MTPQQILLLLHLGGAVVVGFYIFQSLIALFFKPAPTYRQLAVKIGLSSGFQLISGSLLALSSPTSGSLFHFCSQISLYLGATLLVESLLFQRMRATQYLFPSKLVSSSLSAGLAVTVFTILKLYIIS